MDELSCMQGGYEHDPRYRAGSWNGKKNFFKISVVPGGWFFKVPIGFKKRVEDLLNTRIQSEDLYKFDNRKPYQFLTEVMSELPFRPYKHQLKMFMGMASNQTHLGIAATGAGKSLVAYLLVRYFRTQNKKVLLVVPTIDLTLQLQGDFKSYNATDEFMSTIQLMGGEFNKKEIKQPILISTYQSCSKADLSSFDIVINDETHLAKAETLLSILRNDFDQKLGMTGTMPLEELDAMLLEQNFGQPKKYITARQLIDLGLATDVSIVPIFLHQKQKIMKYQDEITFIKESPKRRAFVSKFLNKLPGLSVALYNHTQHGKDTYKDVTGCELTPTLMKSFEEQKKLKVFFLSGSTHSATRKKILAYMSALSNEKILVIGQIKLLSTGINIKALKHLVFLASTKSQTTVIQSIGRVLRLHDAKNRAVVFDLVDDFSNHGKRKTENYSLKHFWQRLSYYEMQDLSVVEREFDL
ncbi:MAG: DEAD/DEAH box helicase family protein [Clostridiales bacterium]|nr:DEAD/DEAH box helicase family protein [Clostridiales bacterium]